MKNGNTIKNRKFLQKGIYGLILPIIFIFVISMYESEVIYIYSDYALGETIGYSIFPIFLIFYFTLKYKDKIFRNLIFGFIVVIIFSSASKDNDQPRKYPVSGFDTITAFGDGRFQILKGGNPSTYALFDNNALLYGKRSSECLIVDIKKYIEIKNKVYISAFHSCKFFHKTAEDKIPMFERLDPETGEFITYDINQVPKYTILNYETGEMELYRNLEDIPEESRKIFEKKLNFWCKFKADCYEERPVIKFDDFTREEQLIAPESVK